MTTINQQYLKDCLENNDLFAFGIYDTKQDYGIFHKWGNKKDVMNVVKVMKQSIAKTNPFKDDVYIIDQYPTFSEEDLQRFIDTAGYWAEWHKKRSNEKK